MPEFARPSAMVHGAHLRLDGISKSYPDRRVFTDITMTVGQGERLALIGQNGAGKSTLLRIAAGVDQPDRDSVQAPGRVSLLWQQPPFARSDPVAEVLERALAVPRALLRELADATAALEKDAAAAGR